MEKTELWHVFVDNGTGERSRYYGYRDALTFNLEGEFMQVMQGKTEIPIEGWTCGELCWMISGCLEGSKMGRLSNFPKAVLWAMEKCGVEEGKRKEVLMGILDKTSATGLTDPDCQAVAQWKGKAVPIAKK